MDKIAAGKPMVAAIDGACLGGGMEVRGILVGCIMAGGQECTKDTHQVM